MPPLNVATLRHSVPHVKLGKPIVFIDLETTGLDVNTERIVELALVKVLPGRKVSALAVQAPTDDASQQEIHHTHTYLVWPGLICSILPFTKSLAVPACRAVPTCTTGTA